MTTTVTAAGISPRWIWVSAINFSESHRELMMRGPWMLVFLACCVFSQDLLAGADYKASFLALTFPSGVPKAQVLKLDEEKRSVAEQILGHSVPSRRHRYWSDGVTSAWIMNEVGKERPITIAVLIKDQEIIDLQILKFRESRGWEVKYPFFTRQFMGVTLRPEQKLDKKIDGISGATLSVTAVKKVARLALFLDSEIHKK